MSAAPSPSPPVPVRIDRLRARIAARPAAARKEPAGEALYQAVRKIGALDTDDPEELARHLAGSGDGVLRTEAFRITREALRAGLLPAASARTIVEDLAAGVPDALCELAAPWAVLDPLPHGRMRRLLDAGPARVAIEVAARHGHRDLLAGLAGDPRREPVLRRRCLELLGDLATREDVGAIVATAARDPLLLAGPAVTCLGGLHRRGHFPDGQDVPAIVGLALADHAVPAGDLAVVLYPRRHEALKELTAPTEPTAADGNLPRRLDLLVALDEQGAPDLGIGDAVTGLARGADDPAPFLRAIRRLRHAAAEETVLELLPRSPREALGALEAVGGARTVAVLRDGLGLAGGDVAAHLRPYRHRALEILWHLNGDAGLRRTILERLDPRDLPRRIADDLGGPDARELAALRANPGRGDPAAALRRLAANGDATTLPAIADLLLRVAAQEDGPVPDEIVAAVGELGGGLWRRGALRPRCLLDAADAADAGNALVADMVLRLLARPGLRPAERTTLLDVLRRAPHRRTRARVHRLLRDRDRHVRAGAIAILALDGGDALALSASLIPLTAAGDVQTVRQAILALAEAGASWAAPAIAGCLDHPNMNVKKAAASALARAGGPEAVPKLLSWLGRHDNPGLREAIVGALRAILGDAFAATVLAAADRAADPSPLLRSLDGLLDECAVEALARRGVTVRGRTPPPVPDVDALLDGGWDTETALRVLDAHESEPLPYWRLRPALVRWLDLAVSDPRAVRLVTEICRPPLGDAEAEVLARSAGTLVDGLAAGGDHDRLLALLAAAVPRLGRVERLAVAERARGLDAGRAGLVVLRLCAVSPTRDDVVRALAVARRGERPEPDQEAVLREAFGQEATEDSAPLRGRLGDAIRDAGSLRRARERTDAPSRAVLDALISVFAQAPPGTRDLLLDWMLELQPLGAPPWTIAEESRRPVADVRTPHSGDLDQPRSDAQRRRLLAMLDDPQTERRENAARMLLDWPEPQAGLAVLKAYLHGRVGLAAGHRLAGVLDHAAESDLTGGGAVDGRFARLASYLDTDRLDRFVPRLLAAWEHGDAATSEAAGRALRRASPDVVAGAVSGRLAAGAWGLLDLVACRPVLPTPELIQARERLRDEGRDDRAAKLVLAEGPLRAPGAAARDEEVLNTLRERPAGTAREPSRAELFRVARGAEAKAAGRALTRLAERHEEAGATADPELADLLATLIVHGETKVRLHAHRVSRRVLDRPAYLDQTVRLLDDPEPAVVRSAIRTLAHAAWKPAVPGLVALLAHPRESARKAAADGLVMLGSAAVPALRHAEGRARPDRRHRYTSVLDRMTA
ncbi:HEAT repeat domain-containing protein [Actinomadura sp. B10D3]|uniref:HEAT repeat domain-containing protein n=1 Tax=Actinomadura sp. B10D3 TaxID=3153557 RepID=UPI00325F861E